MVALSEFSTGTVSLACPARAGKEPAMGTSEPIKFFTHRNKTNLIFSPVKLKRFSSNVIINSEIVIINIV